MMGIRDIAAVEARLPFGFEPVDPFDLPDFGGEVLRVELVDVAGNVRPWEWSDAGVEWHEAIGWRVAPDGVAQHCDVCGRLTKVGYYDGPATAPTRDRTFIPICPNCDGDGFDC